MGKKAVLRTLLLWPLPVILAAVALATLIPGLARGVESKAEIVARVNGEVVTRDELQSLLGEPFASGRLRQEQSGVTLEPEALQHQAVQELIHRRLLLQEARRRHLTVDETDLDQALVALRRRFDSIDSFGAWMHERGLDDKSLFDALREGLLINRVRAALVAEVHVSDAEVEQYFTANQDGLVIGEEVRLRIIAVRDETTAREILAALEAGEDFGRLARQRSVGQRAAQGGDTGWVDVRGLPPLLQDVVARLAIDDVGGPLRKADDEFLLVGLAGRRPLLATSLAAARPAIEQRLLVTRQRETIQTWLVEQEKAATIEWLYPPR